MRSEKQTLACPICGHTRADITRINGRYFIGCWSCEADGMSSGDWLRAVAERVDAPGGGALLDDPERWLAPYINGTSRRGSNGPPAELPSLAKVKGWHDALLSNKKAMRHLLRNRGLNLRMIGACKIGYGTAPGKYPDWTAFILPVFAAPTELINVRKRFWPEVPVEDGKPVKYVGLGGRGSNLYPSLPPACPGLRGIDALLVAGEFDALVARQLRLPAVSSTCGAQLPQDLVKPLISTGPRIAVMFDVGEEQAAERAVALLRREGSRAWVVDSPLTTKGADLSDLVAAGATREELLDLIKQARRS